MTSIYDIKQRAQQLSEKTDAESISPAEVGGLFSDLADYTNDVEVNGSSLGIRKTYTSVSAMEADKNPVGDDGKPLKKGQLVNIYNQDDPSSADNNKVFSWQNPGWQIRTTLDAGYATREELTELEEKLGGMVNESIDNIEYIRAYVDSEGKFLWGIKVDGSIEWAKGIPYPIQNTLRKLEKMINDKSSAIDVINATLEALTNTFVYQDNEEFFNVITDSVGKVLFGIKSDGKPFFPNNEMYHVESNQEFLAVWLDSVGHVLFGLRHDGSTFVSKSDFKDDIVKIKYEIDNLNMSLNDIRSILFFNDNEEFLYAVLDNDNKIIEGVRTNGKKYFPKQELFDKYEDVEGCTELTLDAENRILGYRNKEGVRHETKLDVKSLRHKGYEIDFNKYATKHDLNDVKVDASEINIADLNGVSNHNTPNLLIPSELEKTFNDGTNSFTPPNEGYEMSNPIECQAGDWFTRTGTATGMVVVTDNDDKNGTRIFNSDGSTLGNTFQIPADMTWAKYVRMAVEVGGANDGSVVICKGKYAYTNNDRGDYITVDKLRLKKTNFPKDIKYLTSADGKYWEMYVDESHQLQIREIDPDIITELPSNFKAWTLTGSFDGKFDRMCIPNNNFLIEIKETGVTKYKDIGTVVNGNFANFEHFYTPNGEDRYGFIFSSSDSNVIGKGFTLFDGEFNILETNIGFSGTGTPASDLHDFIYISDEHIILFGSNNYHINVPGYENSIMIVGVSINELKKENGTWKVIGNFKSYDYPTLYTDAFGNLGENGGTLDTHQNTIELDYDGNLLLNLRNWDTFLKIKRIENSDGTVTIGSKTFNYNEAIIGRVGGRHNSGYIESKRVINEGFSFTDVPQSLTEMSDDTWEEWQWYHCHDVKYWGMKTISGQQYPTYTLFDNNYWTNNEFVKNQHNIVNRNNNIDINPNGTGNYYTTSKDKDENYAKYQHSRVIQISIDWENHKIMDYRIYYIPKLYSKEQSGATMYDEGIICIDYSYAGIFGLWDFTTEETEVTGHIYKGAKEIFKGEYNTPTTTYRTNTYKINV